jgi:hypothetical protein
MSCEKFMMYLGSFQSIFGLFSLKYPDKFLVNARHHVRKTYFTKINFPRNFVGKIKKIQERKRLSNQNTSNKNVLV